MNGKQLKNSILQWAIQGKLVPQDHNDEPASDLLERIRAEKARLVKEGKIKKDKNESIIFRGEDNSHYEKFPDGRVVCIDDEIPFEVPQGWEWARFGSITFNRDSERIPLSVSERSGLAKVYDYYGASGIIDKVDKFLFNEPLLLIGEDGANLINRSTPIAFIANGRYWVNNHAHVIDCKDYMEIAYLCLFINAISLSPYVTGTAQPKMNQEKMNSILVAIPPKSEQLRIVNHFKEIEPLIHQYANAQVRLDNLNTIVKEHLRKSILQEAIKGALVLQDPTDEPATVLLNHIREEKQKLLKDGKLKKKDVIDSVIYKGEDNKYYETIAGANTEIELPFVFPDTWVVVRLQHICALLDGQKRTGDGICIDAKFLRGKSAGVHIQSGRYVQKGDNIILVDGENSGEVFSVPIDGYLGSTFKQLWISESLYIPYILECIRFYKDELRNSKKGAAIPHLNKDIFRGLIIGIPPIKEQRRIVERIQELYKNLQD